MNETSPLELETGYLHIGVGIDKDGDHASYIHTEGVSSTHLLGLIEWARVKAHAALAR